MGTYIFYSIIGAIIFLLIYSVWFNPDSVSNFYEDVKEKTSTMLNVQLMNSSSSSNSINKIRIVPSEMEEYGFWGAFYKSCAGLEANAEAEGISNIKQKACREACGLRNMEYYSNDCEIDLLVCYCKL